MTKLTDFFGFEPFAGKFSKANALAMAHCSALAYPHKDDEGAESPDAWAERVASTTMEWGFEDVYIFDYHGAQAFLAIRQECMIASFRGTETNTWDALLNDLRDDLRVKKTGAPLAGRCHRGFKAALHRIWLDERELIGAPMPSAVGMERVIHNQRDEFANRNGGHKPALYFTGHSLGAGMATLAAAELIEEDQPVWGLYTFGSPRTGDSGFEEKFNAKFKRAYRVVNNNDLIARVPTRGMGYAHVGEFILLTELGEIVIEPSTWTRILDRGLGYLLDIGEAGFDSLKDHGIATYVEQLSS